MPKDLEPKRQRSLGLLIELGIINRAVFQEYVSCRFSRMKFGGSYHAMSSIKDIAAFTSIYGAAACYNLRCTCTRINPP